MQLEMSKKKNQTNNNNNKTKPSLKLTNLSVAVAQEDFSSCIFLMQWVGKAYQVFTWNTPFKKHYLK